MYATLLLILRFCRDRHNGKSGCSNNQSGLLFFLRAVVAYPRTQLINDQVNDADYNEPGAGVVYKIVGTFGIGGGPVACQQLGKSY